MCGICGFFNLARDTDAPRLIQAMAQSLNHRGPDATGTWLDDSRTVGLANTRLAIIDIEGGNQPLFSNDGSQVIVYNGEIYGFQKLRAELTAFGQHEFRTDSDTEVLLNAYRQWGIDCLQHVGGMFAFAIYDETKQQLFLARDRTGIKPLYYHLGPAGFFFASELKAMLMHTKIPRRVNYRALADYVVFGFPLAPATFFADCHEVEPGTWMVVSRSGIRTGRYWKWSRGNPITNGAPVLDRLESELTESTREHLVSDVPVGAFLSGGIDSSVLVSIAAKNLGVQLQTFTVRFRELEYDESAYARIVAEKLGTVHCEIEVGDEQFNTAIAGKILDQFDQPFSDPSAIPTYLLCREIRKHVKVVLAGDGGDEMFGGYPRFRYAAMARALGHMPAQLLHAADSTCAALRTVLPIPTRQARRLLRAAIRSGSERIDALTGYVCLEEIPNILKPEVLDSLHSYAPSLCTGVRCNANAGGPELMDATIVNELPGDYLRKVDVMSSAHGLEVRVPYLGDRILKLAASIPAHLKYSWWQNKILLRKLAARNLPAVIAGKKKWGFGIPLDTWLGERGRAEVCDVLRPNSAYIRQFINPSFLRGVVESFVAQEWDESSLSRESLFRRVYLLWGLERWLDRWRPAA
jgi:asparagine synthase (glutamine-hydrolysing)